MDDDAVMVADEWVEVDVVEVVDIEVVLDEEEVELLLVDVMHQIDIVDEYEGLDYVDTDDDEAEDDALVVSLE